MFYLFWGGGLWVGLGFFFSEQFECKELQEKTNLVLKYAAV